jgi:hypothetical protein
MLFTGRSDALPPKKRALRSRRLVVVEIESVAEGAVRSSALASWAQSRVEEAIALREGEQVIVGATHRSILATRMAWPQPRIVTGAHTEDVQDGLLQILRGERIAERFDELVLASGNGIFADAIAALAAGGVKVTVLAWPESLSRRLHLAAAETLPLRWRMSGLGGVG